MICPRCKKLPINEKSKSGLCIPCCYTVTREKYLEKSRKKSGKIFEKIKKKIVRCPGCNGNFLQKSKTIKYCNDECKHRAKNKKLNEKWVREGPRYFKRGKDFNWRSPQTGPKIHEDCYILEEDEVF